MECTLSREISTQRAICCLVIRLSVLTISWGHWISLGVADLKGLPKWHSGILSKCYTHIFMDVFWCLALFLLFPQVFFHFQRSETPAYFGDLFQQNNFPKWLKFLWYLLWHHVKSTIKDSLLCRSFFVRLRTYKSALVWGRVAMVGWLLDMVVLLITTP